MKRFFRRAGCAPPDDSRRRGAALCHLAGAHRTPASDLKGLDSHRMRSEVWRVELRDCPCGKGGHERGAGNPERIRQRTHACVFGFD